MHAAAAAQLTAFSSLNCAPGGTGAGWMRHRAPSRRSARTFEFEVPTAVQRSAAGHATANRVLDEDPAGLGVGWMRQCLPFHPRASVDTTPRVGPAAPTATHRSVAGQAIPFSWLSAAPAGLGTFSRRQRPSRHRSPTVTGVPAPLPTPTAVQSDAAGQDTPLRLLPLARAGLGVGWACQVLPFHRSPNVTVAPELSLYSPTASHEDAAQETLSKRLD